MEHNYPKRHWIIAKINRLASETVVAQPETRNTLKRIIESDNSLMM